MNRSAGKPSDAPRLGHLVPGPPWGEPPTHPCGQLASWAHRVFGRVIDFAVVAVPALVVGELVGSRAVYDLVAVALVLGVGYCNGAIGQSPGKRIVGLRLVRERDGAVPGGAAGVIREIAHLIDSFSLLIGWFFPLWDRKRQTFADKACGTVVVRL